MKNNYVKDFSVMDSKVKMIKNLLEVKKAENLKKEQEFINNLENTYKVWKIKEVNKY